MSDPHGVVFPLVDGSRSTSATGRAVVSDALAIVDPPGSAAAAREVNWRRNYPVHFRRLLEAGLQSPQAARSIAGAGLHSVHERMRFLDADGSEMSLAAAMSAEGEDFGTEEVDGRGSADEELTLPYRGTRLSGQALRDRLEAWVEAGVVEPSCAEAVGLVIAHPEWLSLPGRTVVVIGAAAEMGPLRSLLRWGATVAAVDLPRDKLWRDLFDHAARYAGRLVVPTRGDARALANRAGADLLVDLAPLSRWIAGLDGDLTLGNYVYADGATNVRVCTAVDALSLEVLAARPGTSLAFLATPTDVFAVPEDAVRYSSQAYASSSLGRFVRAPLRAASGGRLLRRNYLPGTSPGINDSVVPQQGPNYLLAKRIQRWRATAARDAGVTVSFKVAPPTRTRSVVKNQALAAAYAGAHRFGIEVFDPATSNTLMAALLVHDLMAAPLPQVHPWQDEAVAAAHGGLWRAAYEPRSALGIAAVLGVAANR